MDRIHDHFCDELCVWCDAGMGRLILKTAKATPPLPWLSDPTSWGQIRGWSAYEVFGARFEGGRLFGERSLESSFFGWGRSIAPHIFFIFVLEGGPGWGRLGVTCSLGGFQIPLKFIDRLGVSRKS